MRAPVCVSFWQEVEVRDVTPDMATMAAIDSAFLALLCFLVFIFIWGQCLRWLQRKCHTNASRGSGMMLLRSSAKGLRGTLVTALAGSAWRQRVHRARCFSALLANCLRGCRFGT